MDDFFWNNLHQFIDLIGKQRSLAIIVGLLFSGLSTQFFKSAPNVAHLRYPVFAIRVWSFFAGALSTVILYPPPLAERVIVSLTIGFAPMTLYYFTVRILDWKWPGLRKNLSHDNKGDPNAPH